jgi:hypothetical protein
MCSEMALGVMWNCLALPKIVQDRQVIEREAANIAENAQAVAC